MLVKQAKVREEVVDCQPPPASATRQLPNIHRWRWELGTGCPKGVRIRTPVDEPHRADISRDTLLCVVYSCRVVLWIGRKKETRWFEGREARYLRFGDLDLAAVEWALHRSGTGKSLVLPCRGLRCQVSTLRWVGDLTSVLRRRSSLFLPPWAERR